MVRVVAVLATVALLTTVLNVVTVYRFIALAEISQAIDVRILDVEFSEETLDLSLTFLFSNRGSSTLRVEYFWFTITGGGSFVGTVVGGHGPKLNEPVGPEFLEAGQEAVYTTTLALKEIHVSKWVRDAENIGVTGYVELHVMNLGLPLRHAVRTTY